MSFKSDLYSYLIANGNISYFVSGRIYPGFAPSSAARPFIIYERTSSDSTHSMGSPSSSGNALMKDTIQFTVYAESEDGCNEIKELLQEELDGIELSMGETSVRRIFLSSESDGVEMPANGENDCDYRETIGFTFWYRRAYPAPQGYILCEDSDRLVQENGYGLLVA